MPVPFTLPQNSQPIIDARGNVNRPWYLFFQAMFTRVGGATGDDTSHLVDLIETAQETAEQALVRSTSKPGSPSQSVSQGELIDVAYGAAGYSVSVDVGQMVLANRVFA
jgi:hypothetical protein